MNNNDINATLFELQQNLKNLSSVKDQVNFFQEKSHEITSGISVVQRKYVEHLQDLKLDYENRINDLKNELTTFLSKTQEENTMSVQQVVAKSEETIGKGIEKFEVVSDKINASNNEKIEAINSLLEHYKNLVEASNSLIDTLESIDFPTKLDVLSSKSQLIIESITSANQALEIKMIETQNSIIEKVNISFDNVNKSFEEKMSQSIKILDKQNKELATLKILLFVIISIGLIGLAMKFV